MGSPTRKPIRLKDFDYSENGVYFLTICTKNKAHLLSDVHAADNVFDLPCVRLRPYGQIVESQIQEMNRVYSDVHIDKYVIMPNHVHLLVVVSGNGSSRTPTPTNSKISILISLFKRFTNRKCAAELWQRSYHDHIIRSEADYQKHWQYIEDNPSKWSEDEYYTENEQPFI